MEQLTVINRGSKCCFCGLNKNNYLKYGPIYRIKNITAHYYCVLLSSRLIQNGNDDEGILGFLYSDIKKELQRTANVLCFYCKKNNANIECAKKKCKRTFHLPCGLEFGSSHQFVNQFKSFCHLHQLVQNIPSEILVTANKTVAVCCICYEKVNVRNKKTSLWAPCCVKTWYHRTCVQKLAHSAGYFFKCAACNDVEKFKEWMERYGIFIPMQDASWELVPNAFEDLLFRYSKCDAVECKCPKGRQSSNENTIWEIILCGSCGSQGMHVGCGNLRFHDPEWECPSCIMVTSKLKSGREISEKTDEGSSEILILTQISQKKRRRRSEDIENSVLDKRKKVKCSEEEDDVDIDVVTVEDVPEGEDNSSEAANEELRKEVWSLENCELRAKVKEKDWQKILKNLKPGPLSYKLSVIRKILGNSFEGTDGLMSKSSSSETDIIELSDSDDDDVEMIEEKNNQTAEERSIFLFRVQKKRLESNEEESSCTEDDVTISEISTESTSSADEVEVKSVQTGKTAGGRLLPFRTENPTRATSPDEKTNDRQIGGGKRLKEISKRKSNKIQSKTMAHVDFIFLVD